MSRYALVASLVAVLAGAAAADEREPQVAVAVGAGTGIALVPLLAGGVLWASSQDDDLHRTGMLVAMAGLTAAPVVAHLIVHEYKRALIFAALPLAGLIANIIVMELEPQVTTYGNPGTRVTFGVALTAGVVGATVGLADTFAAPDRWRRAHSGTVGVEARF
jgi:hypothetical protein